MRRSRRTDRLILPFKMFGPPTQPNPTPHPTLNPNPKWSKIRGWVPKLPTQSPLGLFTNQEISFLCVANWYREAQIASGLSCLQLRNRFGRKQKKNDFSAQANGGYRFSAKNTFFCRLFFHCNLSFFAFIGALIRCAHGREPLAREIIAFERILACCWFSSTLRCRLVTTHDEEQACIKFREKNEWKKIYKCISFQIEFFLFFLFHIRPNVKFDWRAANHQLATQTSERKKKKGWPSSSCCFLCLLLCSSSLLFI